MSLGLPIVGPDVKVWANDLRRYLARQWDRLSFRTSGQTASDNGVLLWDEANGYPVVSKSGVWRQVSLSDVVFVSSKDDLPDAIAGVITLAASATYYITGALDLTGDRLVCGDSTVILGASSENSSIKSTGLTSAALITSVYTLPIRHITLEATTIFDLDASLTAGNQAIDWYGVNLSNTSDIGTIKGYSNFVVNSMAFLGASGLIFDGTSGTISFTNTLFQASSGTIVTIAATATIERRFRIIYSSVVSLGTAVGIDVSTSATIPVEGYILDTVNFSGAGTYTAGVTFSDNKARWIENRGVQNTAAVTSYYMQGNVTATVISVTGTPVKVAGTTTESAVSQKFDNTTSNKALYQGAILRDFKVTVVLTLSSGNGHQVGVYIAKNGTVLNESETYLTTNASGRLENGVVQVLTALDDTDYIEVFVENNTATTNVTVADMNVIVGEL